VSFHHLVAPGQAKALRFTASCGERPVLCQPPKEKCDPKLCANEPKPPRVTPPEPESEAPDDVWLEAESLEKKLLREDEPPPPEPPEEDPRGGHSAFACGIAGPAIPGEGGRQFSLGISA
jgi:hypothetical protein